MPKFYLRNNRKDRFVNLTWGTLSKFQDSFLDKNSPGFFNGKAFIFAYMKANNSKLCIKTGKNIIMGLPVQCLSKLRKKLSTSKYTQLHCMDL